MLACECVVQTLYRFETEEQTTATARTATLRTRPLFRGRGRSHSLTKES